MRATTHPGSGAEGIPFRPTGEWRVGARIEEHIPGLVKDTLWIRILAWSLFLVGGVFAVGVLRQPLRDDGSWVLYLKSYMVMVGMQLVLVYLYRRVSDYIHLAGGLKKLKHKVPNEQACPVRLNVRQNGVITGQDEGFLWLDGGTLYYKGLQSVFRLNREDIPPLEMWPGFMRPNPSAGKLPTALPIPTDRHLLSIDWQLIDAHEDFTTRRRAHDFQVAVWEWVKDRPEGSLETLLPPRDLHPAYERQGATKFEPILGAGSLLSVNVILFFLMAFRVEHGPTQEAWHQMGLIAHGLMTLQAVRLAWKVTKDARVREELRPISVP